MPRAGFKSLTLGAETYDKLQAHYESIKDQVRVFGINSFSGFITFSLESLYEDGSVFGAFVDSMSERQKSAFEKLRERGHA